MSLAAWEATRTGKPVGTAELATGQGADAAAQVHALTQRWGSLALLALGASTLFALVLVFARTPFLALGADYFRTALVLHVDLAVVVWFLAAACALWAMAAPVSGRIARRLVVAACWAAACGVLLMLLTPLAGNPAPILANYVPLLDSPIFYWGVVLFFVGVTVCALVSLGCFASRLLRHGAGQVLAWHWFAAGAMIAFLVAMVVFARALSADADALSMDDRIWGGGHVLQVVHTLMLMAAWLALAETALARLRLPRMLIFSLLGLAMIAPLADLGLALVHSAGSLAYRQGFTEVMRWLTWPAPVVLAVFVVQAYRRSWTESGRRIEDIHVLATVALFVLGCLVGASIRGETTSIPAHYHGTVGAVTLIYMVWARAWLLGRGLQMSAAAWWRWQPLVYAAGISLLVFGLAWAGWLGVPRKSPHADGIVDGVRYSLAMGVAGTGGLLATLGAGLFVFGLGRAIALSWWRNRWKVAS